MANPRQRRKQRSGTSKIKNSKKSVKNKHKVVVKGPQVLVENWDKTKTVRQNYKALGLLPALNPRQSGGLEPNESTPFAIESRTEVTMQDLESYDPTLADDSTPSSDDEEQNRSMEAEEKKGKEKELVPGLGRIERDPVTGKVLRIVLPGKEKGQEIVEEIKPIDRSKSDGSDDEDDDDSDDDNDDDKEEEEEEQVETPWGEPMKDWDEEDEWNGIEEDGEGDGMVRQGIPIGKGAKRKEGVEAKTEVVKTLEALAATSTKVERHTSEFEYDWLVSLVKKYDDDVGKMTRDRKLNVWQKTRGELLRAVKKAGGFEVLRRFAAEDQ